MNEMLVGHVAGSPEAFICHERPRAGSLLSASMISDVRFEDKTYFIGLHRDDPRVHRLALVGEPA